MNKNKIQELDKKIMEVIEMIAEGMDRGYEDEYAEALYIAKDSLKKLEKIKQIVKDYDGTTSSMIKQFSEIQKALEENN